MLNNFIKKQIFEIKESSQLRFYGFFLSLTHLWTFLYWKRNDFFIANQTAINAEPLCFPFFPNCDLWRASISATSWTVILYSYLALALLTSFLFLKQRFISWAFVSFILLSFFKLVLHLSNYNFMGNYHYMIHIVSLLFLALPNKSQNIKYLIVAFYIAAGFLKINFDWLSGAAMIAPTILTGKVLSLSLYYVVLLELVVVFGLLHPATWIRRISLLQFILFHIFSWHVVGFYYPMVMFSLLSLFALDEFYFWKNGQKAPNLLKSLTTFKSPTNTYIFLSLFIFLQVIPFLLTADPSLSGVARLSSLNMFDSKTTCQTVLIAHRQGASTHIEPPMKNLGVRLSCDPIVFLNQAHQLCRKNTTAQKTSRISLALLSRRVTQTQYKKILDINDVCSLKKPLWAEIFKREQS